MAATNSGSAHLIAGGFPPGSMGGHDHDYARLRLLGLLAERDIPASVANDFADVEKWLPTSRLLITYVAGPYPDAAQSRAIRDWLEVGGHWLGLHGTSGGKAERVEGMRTTKDQADDAAKAKNTMTATMDRPANGLPEDLREHARLMCDIIAIAFQTNRTSVASLIISRDLSAMYYPFLDVKDGHHAASHNNNSDGYERIARFHVSQFAYLASKLDSMKEGDGTVLDNTCLMFLSNLWIGRKHDNFRLPLVLAGGLGGTLETGRTLNYLDAGEDNRKMCSLYLSLMDRYGVKLEQFGDARERLVGL